MKRYRLLNSLIKKASIVKNRISNYNFQLFGKFRFECHENAPFEVNMEESTFIYYCKLNISDTHEMITEKYKNYYIFQFSYKLSTTIFMAFEAMTLDGVC